MTLNQAGESSPNVDFRSVVTFSGVVVVAIAISILAERSSWIRRVTPGRNGIRPRLSNATKCFVLVLCKSAIQVSNSFIFNLSGAYFSR